MGRTSDAREKILSAAQSLIELRGYSALGVAEICKAADTQLLDTLWTNSLSLLGATAYQNASTAV